MTNNNILHIRCIAKTCSGQQCKNTTKSYFCHIHKPVFDTYVQHIKHYKSNSSHQQIGGFISALPICLDIANCNWIADIDKVIPGINYVLSLLS